MPQRHLISIDDLTVAEIEHLLDAAQGFELTGGAAVARPLGRKTVASLFFEASTRTSMSFELAAKRLGADVVSLKAAGSSVEKGESLVDTIQTIDAYSPDAIVMRHSSIGAPRIAAQYTHASILNAGDGAHQHPTQCLLDLYTIRQQLGRLKGVRVAIVGDIHHSRVARSNIRGLRRMGALVHLVGPPTLLPKALAAEDEGVTFSHDISTISSADVVYVLRMQRERMGAGSTFMPSLREYVNGWCVTPDRVSTSQWIMHPGPMNRGVELDGSLADGPQSLIARQVEAGLYVRMAALQYLMVGMPKQVTNKRRFIQRNRNVEVAAC
jgi:aspartate carbamoyltransferase catalytic subunit